MSTAANRLHRSFDLDDVVVRVHVLDQVEQEQRDVRVGAELTRRVRRG
jgi:hypothetical protein